MHLGSRAGVSLSLASCALGAAVLAPSPGWAQQRQKPDPSSSAFGETIYRRYCGACHGIQALGDGPLAKELRTPPPDLTQLARRSGGKFSFEEVARTIDGRKTPRAHGTPDMPVWGEVFASSGGTGAPDVDTAVARITHYVWSIQK